jgi:hypothetical protein
MLRALTEVGVIRTYGTDVGANRGGWGLNRVELARLLGVVGDLNRVGVLAQMLGP